MTATNNFETQAIRIQSDNSLHREHSVPIHMTSSFTFEDAEHARAMFADEQEGNIYSRFSNPNSNELIEKLCLLEGGEDGIATASGMAAMYSSMAALIQQGDHVLASRALFGSTHQVLTQIFPKWGIDHSYADLDKPEEWEALITDRTKLIFVETPSNPGLDLVDLQWLGNLANARGVVLIVDNCFATPYLQQPLKLGAHLVCHSTTKFIDGQGRTIGGAIVGDAALVEKIRFFCRHTGPAMSPFNAWILSKSLETLAVRLDRHCASALTLGGHLEQHPGISRVKYPFLPSHPQYDLARRQMRHGGGLLTMEVKGGVEGGRKFLNHLNMLSLTANLGDTRTIATHPASTTHSKLSEQERAKVGITGGLVRISVGLEHVDDIIEDIEQALAAI